MYTLVGVQILLVTFILTLPVHLVMFYFRDIIFMMLAIMALFIIPYTIFFYEEDDTLVLVSVFVYDCANTAMNDLQQRRTTNMSACVTFLITFQEGQYSFWKTCGAASKYMVFVVSESMAY